MHRVNRIINDPWYGECIERNAVCEQNRRFCRHDLQHMLDVARITYMLVLEGYSMGDPGGLALWKVLDGASSAGDAAATGMPGMLRQAKEIVYAAGLLHDMARWVQYETGEDHAAAGARMAVEVLDRAGYDAVEQKIISTAILEHRTGGFEASPLGQYICRADDLARPCSRCGARDDCYKINRMETAGLLLY